MYRRATALQPCASATIAPLHLAGALAHHVHAVAGFTNRSLRALVAGMLRTDYSARQMTYDFRRLRLKGLIARIDGTHRYVATPDGIRFAIFCTRLSHRVLAPLFADQPPSAPTPLRRALNTIDRCVRDQLTAAGPATAAGKKLASSVQISGTKGR